MSNSSMKEDIRDLEKFIQLAKKLKIGDRDEYPRIRAEFNVRVIAALLGIEFDQDDDGKFEITDLKEPPSSDEIFHITRLVNNFITNVEERFIPGILQRRQTRSRSRKEKRSTIVSSAILCSKISRSR